MNIRLYQLTTYLIKLVKFLFFNLLFSCWIHESYQKLSIISKAGTNKELSIFDFSWVYNWREGNKFKVKATNLGFFMYFIEFHLLDNSKCAAH